MKFLEDLNPAQIEAVKAVNGPVIIIAGAGSGKTRALTYRVARLIETGVLPARIMLATFTNKAARSMLARVPRAKGRALGAPHLPFVWRLASQTERRARRP